MCVFFIFIINLRSFFGEMLESLNKSSMNAVRNQPTFLDKRKIKQNGLKCELTQMQHNVGLCLLQCPEEKKKGAPISESYSIL